MGERGENRNPDEKEKRHSGFSESTLLCFYDHINKRWRDERMTVRIETCRIWSTKREMAYINNKLFKSENC